MRELKIQIDSAYPQDQGLGKVRMDPETMGRLDVHPGDIVRIIGKKTTLAKVWRSLNQDWNLKKIRIDKYTRANADVAVGDMVTVQNIETVVPAELVTLSPPKEITADMLRGELFDFDGITNLPVCTDDLIAVRTLLPLPKNTAEFKIKSIAPADACIISATTEFEFDDKNEFSGAKKISYEDIGGLKHELAQVREMIELPIRHPELFKTLGVDAPKGVLLYGPPGTGKTLIAKAVASETNAHFYTIAGPEILSKFYGESEERLREIFDDAQQNAPSIIFIDELDSIAPRREDVTGEVERRIVAQLLTMLDGIGDRGQVIVIGATNRPDAIDPALRRPGRFDREIEIGVPSESDRVEILKIHARNMPLEGAAKLHLVKKPTAKTHETYAAKCDRIIADLARVTRGFTGADLASLTREAALIALRRQI
ncbi:MAG TPA: AAA family ATPase, partial [Methanocorpusculum sp.]|nr:AAA family ATPase [Methanocorpusculum sp.]